jgi:hypothetical protein
MRARILTAGTLCLFLVPNVASAQEQIETDRGGSGRCGPSTRPVAVYDENWRYLGCECYSNGCSVGYCTCSPGYNCTVSGTCGCCYVSEDLVPYAECASGTWSAREGKKTRSGRSTNRTTRMQAATGRMPARASSPTPR